MFAAFDTDLLPLCAEFTLSHSQTVQDRVLKELQTSARTPLVTTLRMLRLQRAILVTGMFSLFESLLQRERGWTEPFDQLKECLKESGKSELAERFNDYQLAINVLKHGQGQSYRRLLQKSSKLDFKIKPEGEPFFFEADVSEVSVLIDVDEQFVRRCAALIREASCYGLDCLVQHPFNEAPITLAVEKAAALEKRQWPVTSSTSDNPDTRGQSDPR